MRLKRLSLGATLAIAFWSFVSSANSADLDGLWATNVPQCEKIFVKNKSETSFAKNSDIYGEGFVIAGNKIKAKTATCRVKSRKEDGSVSILLVECATEIMLLDTTFSIRLIDHNTIERLFPGLPELNSRYGRCEM